jgi:hypothetical protein
MDDLDELLTPEAWNEPPDRRGELRERTSRLVRHRRWRGHLRRGLALAACFIAGAGTLWLLQPHTPPPQPEMVAQAPESTPDKMPAPRMIRVESPELLERKAALARGERCVDLYRRAGDGFLERGDDIAALRCYRRSLDNTRPNDLVVQPEQDTWLLMSLKIARQKETNDARN